MGVIIDGREQYMNGGYDKIYEGLITRLRECNFQEVSQRLGLSYCSDSLVSVSFLGREYAICHGGVHPTDGNPVDVNNRNVLAYYTLSGGEGEPAYSYVPISTLAGQGIIFSSNISWMTDPLGKKFSGDYASFRKAMTRLGGSYAGKLKPGCYHWLLKVLPKIPVKIIYQEADDEFSCEVRILFDAKAAGFMEFECLAFLEGCLVKAILGKG